jgi:phenylacetyl-CoA:acceptor oxidoreductase 26-kDa subunit
MELIRPIQQTVWKWPAVINFSLGGMGTGLYLLGALAAMQGNPSLTPVFKLAGPVLASFGFLALTTEAGRPARSINLFRHLRRSWMSRETLFAAIFIPSALFDGVFPFVPLQALALLAALALVTSQGFIVYRARGVTAWNVPSVPPLFVASGLAGGAGLLLLASALSAVLPERPMILSALASVLLSMLVWLRYLTLSGQAFHDATATLRRSASLSLTLGIGQIVPLVLLSVLLSLSLDTGWVRVLATLAGISLVLGGVMQKAGLILRAGYLRAIVLGTPRMPSAARQ